MVDDIPQNIDVRHVAYEIPRKAALNGRRARAIARSDPQPDLILLDIMMPEWMDTKSVVD